MKVDILRECMELYLYLADFEDLGIPISLSQFKACDKEALVRRLWVNNNNDPKVSIFMSKPILPPFSLHLHHFFLLKFPASQYSFHD